MTDNDNDDEQRTKTNVQSFLPFRFPLSAEDSQHDDSKHAGNQTPKRQPQFRQYNNHTQNKKIKNSNKKGVAEECQDGKKKK